MQIKRWLFIGKSSQTRITKGCASKQLMWASTSHDITTSKIVMKILCKRLGCLSLFQPDSNFIKIKCIQDSQENWARGTSLLLRDWLRLKVHWLSLKERSGPGLNTKVSVQIPQPTFSSNETIVYNNTQQKLQRQLQVSGVREDQSNLKISRGLKT